MFVKLKAENIQISWIKYKEREKENIKWDDQAKHFCVSSNKVRKSIKYLIRVVSSQMWSNFRIALENLMLSIRILVYT